jgi:fructose-1,6-bisphosphatase/inositol monophosphatase family enzyme
MSDNFIEDKASRNHILEYITSILVDVNDKIILYYFNNLSPNDINTKTASDDFVSVADKKSEDFITNKLFKFLDITKIIGEESAFINKENYLSLLNEPLLWVIDPIDGTKNYIKGNRNFCSMISLVQDNYPIASFIYQPLERELIYAFKGHGSYKLNVNTKISTKLKIEINPRTEIIGSGGTKGIPDDFRKSILFNLRTYTKRLFIGSAGVETVMMATNKIQFIFHGRVTPWDHSPFHLITKEAGGCVYMAQSREDFNILSKGPILAAANNDIWTEIREIVIPEVSPYRKNYFNSF